jgi:hypothetical protein
MADFWLKWRELHKKDCFEAWVEIGKLDRLSNDHVASWIIVAMEEAEKEGYALGFEDASAGVADPKLFDRYRLVRHTI